VLLFAVRFVLSDRPLLVGRQEKRRDPLRVLVDLAAPNGSGLDGLASTPKAIRYSDLSHDVAGVVKIGSRSCAELDSPFPALADSGRGHSYESCRW